MPSEVRILLSPPFLLPSGGCMKEGGMEGFRVEVLYGIAGIARKAHGRQKVLPTLNNLLPAAGRQEIIGGSSSVGRASAFQAEGRGFEFRLPL